MTFLLPLVTRPPTGANKSRGLRTDLGRQNGYVTDDQINDQRIRPATRRKAQLSFRGYLALILNVIVAAGLWAQLLASGSLYGVEGPTVPFPSFISPLAVLIFVSPCALVVGVVVNIIAGVRGGPNRLAGIIGGLLLLSTIGGLVIAILGTML